MHLYTLKQIWSLVWLKQLQNRGTVIAAKTIISRGLFWFLFCFLVLEILITNKKSSEFCRNPGFYTILKKLSVWDRKQKWGSYIVKIPTEWRVLEAELVCAMNMRKDYCIAFTLFVLFFF